MERKFALKKIPGAMGALLIFYFWVAFFLAKSLIDIHLNLILLDLWTKVRSDFYERIKCNFIK